MSPKPSSIRQTEERPQSLIRSLHGPWWTLNPWSLERDERLLNLAAYLDRAETQQELATCEHSRTYPQKIRNQLHDLGLSSCLVGGSSQETTATLPHLMAASMLCTGASASLGIDVGVNALGLIPIYLGANEDQIGGMRERVSDGAFCSLLLTEISHGSNLLANETSAVAGYLTEDGCFVPLPPSEDCDRPAQPTHYRLNGCKDLINGGRQHELLVGYL